MTSSAFLAELESHIREHRPDLEAMRTETGDTLRIVEQGRLEEDKRHEVQIHAGKDAVVLDWTWRLPVKADKVEELRTLVLDYVTDGIENHGWQVPIVLEGGPLAGRQLTKSREDLVGRLMFARKAEGGSVPQAHLYKWHLQRNDAGEYVCRYEKSLERDEVDAFLRRGVNKTGSFVIIPDEE